jgi:hypothetical protein
MYYTHNGLPLDVDPETKGKNLWVYSPNYQTALINLNREPRFYASIAYDGGTYEFGNKIYAMHCLTGQGQGYIAGNEFCSESGYFSKKFVHPYLSSYDSIKKTYTAYEYPTPILRLAEMYLNYAEADFEYNGNLSNEGLGYLNQIRQRAGLPTLQDSWSIVGGLPTSGQSLREIIHTEREIEMLMETRRYYDLRRWKTAEIELNKQINSWTIRSKTTAGFYTVGPMYELGIRTFYPKNYLLPIPLNDMNVNTNLVQNPGW